VPGLEGSGLLVFPPQATKAATSEARTRQPKANLARRFFLGISSRKKQANRVPALGINQPGLLSGRNVVEGEVVLTVTMEEPSVEVDGVLSEQLP